MVTCTSCGGDVTGKKFCPTCGTAVQPAGMLASTSTCPRCNGEVKSGSAFCMHCGSALNGSADAPLSAPPPPAMRSCPSCHIGVPAASAFCTSCGYNMNSPVAAPSAALCTNCGRQNNPGVRFCAGCGTQIGVPANYMASGQYPPQPQNPQYPQQYGQAQNPQYPPQYGQPQYPQQYGQPQNPQYPQGGYQPQPMMGQQPMVLRCPTCMAMAPLGTAYCLGCRTNLAGIVPTPAAMPVQGQQGGVGGFLQGNGGKYAMGALGGAAAVIGGEMLLHGFENNIENRVEGDLGYPQHRHHHREEGALGGLGEIAKDIGLF